MGIKNFVKTIKYKDVSLIKEKSLDFSETKTNEVFTRPDICKIFKNTNLFIYKIFKKMIIYNLKAVLKLF